MEEIVAIPAHQKRIESQTIFLIIPLHEGRSLKESDVPYTSLQVLFLSETGKGSIY